MVFDRKKNNTNLYIAIDFALFSSSFAMVAMFPKEWTALLIFICSVLACAASVFLIRYCNNLEIEVLLQVVQKAEAFLRGQTVDNNKISTQCLKSGKRKAFLEPIIWLLPVCCFLLITVFFVMRHIQNP